jgi:D-serine deaminase-like pyridoxal phosphate-dependent protein
VAAIGSSGSIWCVDIAALARLANDRIDWRFKGFPARFDGWTVAEVIAEQPALADFGTPLLTLDARALEHNITTMAAYCRAHGVDLAPHGKTTMAPQLIARQLAAGAWGVTAATISHVRAYRAYGVDTIILANQLVDPDALRWVADELRRSVESGRGEFRLLCFADSVAGVEIMQAALADADSPLPVDVVIDLGSPGGRTGCRDVETAAAVAHAVRAADRLKLVGVGGFEGALAPDRSEASLEVIRRYLRSIRDLILRLDDIGEFAPADEIIATAGGSAYFDDVVEILGGAWATSRPVRTVLRSGAYISHDDGHYRRLTPASAAEFRPALEVHGRVLSLPEPGLALLDFGKRDAPSDLGLPEPHTVRRADGTVDPLTRTAITALADQHAFLSYRDDTRLSIGDVVSCGISHPCTAFDKWQLIPVVQHDRVVDIIRTHF